MILYQIKELKHIDVFETLLCLDLLGAADVLVFGVSVVAQDAMIVPCGTVSDHEQINAHQVRTTERGYTVAITCNGLSQSVGPLCAGQCKCSSSRQEVVQWLLARYLSGTRSDSVVSGDHRRFVLDSLWSPATIPHMVEIQQSVDTVADAWVTDRPDCSTGGTVLFARGVSLALCDPSAAATSSPPAARAQRSWE